MQSRLLLVGGTTAALTATLSATQAFAQVGAQEIANVVAGTDSPRIERHIFSWSIR
jgi:hypothetical protein